MGTIQIKKWDTQEVIFEYDGTIKEAVEEAVRQGISLAFADLKYADLIYADLSAAYLMGADLSGANLKNANLNGANLREANFKGADLSGAYLSDANLSGAYLSDANLEGADLFNADLTGANLRGAYLKGVCFKSAKGISDDLMPLACPTEGSFIAWKKVKGKLVKLEIPEDAKRSSATRNKCRCSKAKVLAITNLDETESYDEVFNGNYTPLTYKVGEMAYPDSFDEDRWAECSHGIHFYMDKNDALNWIF